MLAEAKISEIENVNTLTFTAKKYLFRDIFSPIPFQNIKMVRKLKFHEKKLLKKVDFINWEVDNNLHEVKVMRKYCIQKREDYTLYNKLSREVRETVRKIKDLDSKSQHRADLSAQMLEKMYQIGLIPTKWNLELCDNVTASR